MRKLAALAALALALVTATGANAAVNHQGGPPHGHSLADGH